MELSRLDFGEPIPEMTHRFVKAWADHYNLLGSIISPVFPLLEVGTGYGVLACGLARMNRTTVFSLEHPSRSYFHREPYRSFLAENKVTLLGADLTHGLPFAQGVFGTVCLCDVLEHLKPEVIMRTLHEAKRVLKDEGQMVISTPNLGRLSNLVRLAAGHTVNPPLSVSLYGQTYGHIREFAVKELKALLESVGFRIVSVHLGLNPLFAEDDFRSVGVRHSRFIGFLEKLSRIVSLFTQRYRDEIYMVAHKGSEQP